MTDRTTRVRIAHGQTAVWPMPSPVPRWRASPMRQLEQVAHQPPPPASPPCSALPCSAPSDGPPSDDAHPTITGDRRPHRARQLRSVAATSPHQRSSLRGRPPEEAGSRAALGSRVAATEQRLSKPRDPCGRSGPDRRHRKAAPRRAAPRSAASRAPAQEEPRRRSEQLHRHSDCRHHLRAATCGRPVTCGDRHGFHGSGAMGCPLRSDAGAWLPVGLWLCTLLLVFWRPRPTVSKWSDGLPETPYVPDRVLRAPSHCIEFAVISCRNCNGIPKGCESAPVNQLVQNFPGLQLLVGPWRVGWVRPGRW